jgi:hypothetical protein
VSTQLLELRDDGQRLNESGRRQDLVQMDLAMLLRHCAAERDHFRHGRPSDSRYAYELFRRALLERDEAAWELLYSHYRALVERWVQNNGAFSKSSERSDTLVCEAFARFWHAIPPARFTHFPNAAALLHYLQLCASCVVIDNARASARLVSAGIMPLGDMRQRAPEEEVLERMSREDLWHHIIRLLHGEAERVVVFDSFVSGLKPRDICARRRDLFASVQEVYMVKHNVLARLSRDQGLRSLLT